MYEPAHFKVEDQATLFEVIENHRLGQLITAGPGGLMANPIPFILAKNAAGQDVLQGHLARANPQWREIAAGAEVLVVFQGGDHYVTPSWYATKKENGKVVPTWNYVIVQVRGPARTDDSAAFLRSQIEALTGRVEAPQIVPWGVDDAPEPYIAAQLRGIVGIEIEIAAISGKFKLSQNRNEKDFSGVLKGVKSQQSAPVPRDIAGYVEAHAPKFAP